MPPTQVCYVHADNDRVRIVLRNFSIEKNNILLILESVHAVADII